MDEISNRALAVLLVGAIVVSIFGTLLSLNMIGKLPIGTQYNIPTGMAGTQIGNVSLTIGSALSITTADSPTLSFGTCTLTGGNAYFSSDSTNALCTAEFPENITVRNDGNIPANVTFTVNDTGEAHGGGFIQSTTADTSYVAYRLMPGGYGANAGGCWNNSKIDTQTWGSNGSTAANNYINLTGITVKYLGCTNLSSGSTNNSFQLFTHIYVPSSTSAGTTAMTFTFTASNV